MDAQDPINSSKISCTSKYYAEVKIMRKYYAEPHGGIRAGKLLSAPELRGELLGRLLRVVFGVHAGPGPRFERRWPAPQPHSI